MVTYITPRDGMHLIDGLSLRYCFDYLHTRQASIYTHAVRLF